ncbi:MAG: class I SAM-dependent rRNA methyltransferase [Verrucomicrobiales bacterium]
MFVTMWKPEKELLDAAKRKRKAQGFGEDSAFRAFDGLGDGDPGLMIEYFAGRWLAQTPGPLAEAWRQCLVAECLPVWWKRLDAKEKSDPILLTEAAEALPDPFLIRENGIQFEISFRTGYSQGLFLDQRENRLQVRESMRPGQAFLNLFAYTCGFSVAAAMAGAETSSVDLSAPALEWGKRNFRNNGLDPSAHHFPKGDALDYLTLFARKGRQFDGIVLDPPTFSRNRGRVWKVENDFHELVAAAARVTVPGGWLFCSTNCRRLAREGFEDQIRRGCATAGRRFLIDWGGMPPDFTGEPYLHNAWISL